MVAYLLLSVKVGFEAEVISGGVRDVNGGKGVCTAVNESLWVRWQMLGQGGGREERPDLPTGFSVKAFIALLQK